MTARGSLALACLAFWSCLARPSSEMHEAPPPPAERENRPPSSFVLVDAPREPGAFCGGEWTSATTTLRCRELVDTLAPLSGLPELRVLEGVRFQRDDRKPVEVKVLTSLTMLTRLGLAAPELNDITPLASLTELEALSLAGCTGLFNVAPLAGLKRLTHVDLFATKVRDLRPLMGLPLVSLNLSDTEVVDLTALAKLTKLRSLNLGGLSIRDISALRGLTALEELDLGHSGVKDLAPLRSLTKLRRLVIWHTPVADITPLSSLSELEVLYLNGTKVTDISPLSSLTKLEQIGLEGTPTVDEAQISRLRATRPALVVKH